MVLLHGFSNCWRAWTPVLPALEARYSIFAPTAAWHHGGPPLPAEEGTDFLEMVDVLERQLDAEGIERAHLVGNSMGGWLSLELAIRGRALSVVALCPAGGWERVSAELPALARLFRRNEVTLGLARPWLETIARRPRLRALAFRDAVSRPHLLGPALALATMEAAANCRIEARFVPGILEVAAGIELTEVGCPVRIALATEDRLFDRPGHYARLRRLLPDADWIEFEGLGHVPMSDDPATVAAAILDFTGSV